MYVMNFFGSSSMSSSCSSDTDMVFLSFWGDALTPSSESVLFLLLLPMSVCCLITWRFLAYAVLLGVSGTAVPVWWPRHCNGRDIQTASLLVSGCDGFSLTCLLQVTTGGSCGCFLTRRFVSCCHLVVDRCFYPSHCFRALVLPSQGQVCCGDVFVTTFCTAVSQQECVPAAALCASTLAAQSLHDSYHQAVRQSECDHSCCSACTLPTLSGLC